MADLNGVIRTDRDTFDEIAAGQHATETYDDNTLYQVDLDEPIELGAVGSNSHINSDNQLIIEGITLEEYNPSATSYQENVLYYVVES